jgi:hypothetical protein
MRKKQTRKVRFVSLVNRLFLFEPSRENKIFVFSIFRSDDMAVMTKFELSHTYPFMSLNFVIVICLSAFLLNKPVSFLRIFGIGLIVAITVIAARA